MCGSERSRLEIQPTVAINKLKIKTVIAHKHSTKSPLNIDKNHKSQQHQAQGSRLPALVGALSPAFLLPKQRLFFLGLMLWNIGNWEWGQPTVLRRVSLWKRLFTRQGDSRRWGRDGTFPLSQRLSFCVTWPQRHQLDLLSPSLA